LDGLEGKRFPSKTGAARDQLAAMKHFGFHRFGLIGHDRGARVGYRLVLDHPDTVQAFVDGHTVG
jgi:haloacetate dehalogenase